MSVCSCRHWVTVTQIQLNSYTNVRRTKGKNILFRPLVFLERINNETRLQINLQLLTSYRRVPQ